MGNASENIVARLKKYSSDLLAIGGPAITALRLLVVRYSGPFKGKALQLFASLRKRKGETQIA